MYLARWSTHLSLLLTSVRIHQGGCPLHRSRGGMASCWVVGWDEGTLWLLSSSQVGYTAFWTSTTTLVSHHHQAHVQYVHPSLCRQGALPAGRCKSCWWHLSENGQLSQVIRRGYRWSPIQDKFRIVNQHETILFSPSRIISLLSDMGLGTVKSRSQVSLPACSHRSPPLFSCSRPSILSCAAFLRNASATEYVGYCKKDKEKESTENGVVVAWPRNYSQGQRHRHNTELVDTSSKHFTRSHSRD